MTDAEVHTAFAYTHLPPRLKRVSKHFAELADHMCDLLPPSASRTKALNELWQAKNWAVLAAIEKDAAE